MARPNDASAVAGRVQGLREAKAAFQKMPEAFRDATNDATEMTVREIVRNAKARLMASPSIQTRNLYNHVGWSLNRKNGRGRAGVSSGSTVVAAQAGRMGRATVRVKGIVTAGKGGGAAGGKVDRPSRRAHLVEFGARHMPAEPFMIPAADGQKQPYLSRCVAAGKQAEQTLANIGSRNL